MSNRTPFQTASLTVSIQTGYGIYSCPRLDNARYTCVELGFPSKEPPAAIMKYAEDSDEPTDTVYGYVPTNLVVEWLLSEGATQEQLKAFGFKEVTNGVVLI